MRSLILLSLLSAVVLASPTSEPIKPPMQKLEPKPDYNPKPKQADLGGHCEGASGLKCKGDFVCEARVPVPKLYYGICVFKRGEEGQTCNAGTPNDRLCKKGLECVLFGKGPTGKGICEKEAYAKEGEICAGGLHGVSKKCALGLVCINKKPNAPDFASKCYKKGDITVVDEGENCEGETQSKCKSGLVCETANGDIKLCKKKPQPPKNDRKYKA